VTSSDTSLSCRCRTGVAVVAREGAPAAAMALGCQFPPSSVTVDLHGSAPSSCMSGTKPPDHCPRSLSASSMTAGRRAICWTRRGDAGPYCAMELEMQPLCVQSARIIPVSMQGHQTTSRSCPPSQFLSMVNFRFLQRDGSNSNTKLSWLDITHQNQHLTQRHGRVIIPRNRHHSQRHCNPESGRDV
jgi:hypothetical protein